jgi:ankyrin repeat protein
MKNKLFLLLLLIGTLNSYSQKLYKSVEKENFEKVKSLLQKEEDPNEYYSNGLFPLWRATADNNYEISELLIKSGANVNQEAKVPPSQSTSIEIPCQEGYLEIVQLLVENGANVNSEGFRGFTPIRIAAMNDHLEIVKYLALNGANIDKKAMDGATPLEHAASKGHFKVVKFLVQEGANINNKDKEGDFPIGEAAKYGYLDIIQYLIENDADLTLKNDNNKTAYVLAKERGQSKSAELIKKYM